MQSYGKQLSLFYNKYQSFIPPNPNHPKLKEICEYTQVDTLSEWGPNEHFLEYHCLSFTPPNPTLSHQFKLESRQRSNFTAAAIFFGLELSWCSRVFWLLWFFSLFWPKLSTGQSLLISWLSCFSHHTTSLFCSLMNNRCFGPNLGILSNMAFGENKIW